MLENNFIEKKNLANSTNLISAIIPTYRRPVLLKRAIESVLGQTYKNIEVCVYDNASGDDTEKVVAKIAVRDSRVKYYRQKNNIGFAKNFLFGIKRVRGGFFSLLSDDDILLPNFYTTAYNGFLKFPKAKMVATQVVNITENGDVVNNPGHFPAGYYTPPDGFKMMVRHGHPIWTGILFRKEILKLSGLYNPAFEIVGDLEFELRIASQWPILSLSIHGAIFTIHTGSASGSPEKGALICPEGRIKMYKEIERNYEIPHNLKVQALSLLKKRHINALIRSWLHSVINYNEECAIKSSNFLNKMYNLKVLSYIMKKSTILIRCSIFRNSIKLLYSINRYRKERKNWIYQRRCEYLKDYLRM